MDEDVEPMLVIGCCGWVIYPVVVYHHEGNWYLFPVAVINNYVVRYRTEEIQKICLQFLLW